MKYEVILKNIFHDEQVIVLAERPTRALAEETRRIWRRSLGGKNWHVGRRPGLDTLDHLGLKIREVKGDHHGK